MNGSTKGSLLHGYRRSITERAAAESDQTAADLDQTFSDVDQAGSSADDASAAGDQLASDLDQAYADRDRTARRSRSSRNAYDDSRRERAARSSERLGGRLARAGTARDRARVAATRDRNAETRDEIGRARDVLDDHLEPTTDFEAVLIKRLKAVTAQAEADRVRATADRARAASDRARAAGERDELASELRSAHLDHLTGAYRREMGRLSISNEIERARRSDQNLVLAFVDVDRLKAINDRDGHTAGDRVLQTVVQAIRTHLRSFDPISRHGGDEFVCALAGVELLEAKRRFTLINAAIEAEAHVGISVGLAELADGDTVDRLTDRADMAMLRVKVRRHAAVERRRT